MIIPNFNLEISGSIVAWYGAIIATLSMLILGYNAYRDRAKIKIEYRRDMTVFGPQTIYDPQKTYFNITVINKGRRTVKITKAGIRTVGRDKKFAILCNSFSRYRNEILTESNPVSEFMMEQNEELLSGILYICVYDATGKEYRKYLHPFPTFWEWWWFCKGRLKRKTK